jgi:hypothetical protein
LLKYRYEVIGIDLNREQFESECIDYDIMFAIQKYRKIAYSVNSITRKEQVPSNYKTGIFKMATMNKIERE